MLSKAMEVAVKACFHNHLYQFECKVYRQSEGGPIGLRLSMAVSIIVMAMWDKQLAQLGAESGWIIQLLESYVDDITAIGPSGVCAHERCACAGGRSDH